jgi:hypothetical protein
VSNPHTSDWWLWILGAVFCLFGVYVACLNWAALFLSIRNARRGIGKRYSQGPVFGPLSGYLGLTALPIHKSPWVWLVLLLDPSTLVLAVSLPYLFREGYRDQEGMRERLFRTRERLSRLSEEIRGLARKGRR